MMPNAANSEHIKVDVRDSSNPCYECCLRKCGECQGFIYTWICCCCCTSPYRRVQEGFVGVVTEFGKFKKLYPPGYYYVNACTEDIIFVDKRERVLDIRRQNCQTKDNIDVIVDAVVYFQVVDTKKSLFEIENVHLAVAELARTALRDVFGKVTLQEALTDRDAQAERLQQLIDPPAMTWGVDVTRVLIQEILFTPDLQAALSTKVTAKRNAESKVIGAQADVQAARLMRNAADILSTPAAMQVRYLDALSSLSRSNAPKVVFFPPDFASFGAKKLENMNKSNKM